MSKKSSASKVNTNTKAVPAGAESAEQLVDNMLDPRLNAQTQAAVAAQAKDAQDKALKAKKDEESKDEEQVAEASEEQVEETAEASSEESEQTAEASAEGEEVAVDAEAVAEIEKIAAELDGSAISLDALGGEFPLMFAQAGGATAGTAAGGAAAAAGISTTAIVAGVAVVGVAAAAGGGGGGSPPVDRGSGDGTTGGDSGTDTGIDGVVVTNNASVAGALTFPGITTSSLSYALDSSALQSDSSAAAFSGASSVQMLSFTASNTVNLSTLASSSLFAVSGTTGSDLFQGSSVAALSGQTLDGDAGTDVVYGTTSGGSLSGASSLRLVGIEIVRIDNGNSDATTTVSAANFDSDTAELWNYSSAGDVSFTDVGSVDVRLGVYDTKADTSFALSSTSIASTNTKANVDVSLAGVTGGTITIDDSASKVGLASITLSSDGSSANTVAAIVEGGNTDTVKTLVLKGEQDLTITGELDDSLTAITTVDASALGGNMVFSFGALASTTSITAGGGDADAVSATVSASVAPTIVRVDSLNLTFSKDATVTATAIKGLDTIKLAGSGAASFADLGSGVSFSSSSFNDGAAATVGSSKIGFRSTSDFNFTASKASTAAEVNMGDLSLTSARNVVITSSNSKAVNFGNIDLDSDGRGLSVSNAGLGNVVIGDFISDASLVSLLSTGQASGANGDINTGDLKAVDSLALTATALSKGDVTVGAVTSSGAGVGVDLNSTSASIKVGAVSAETDLTFDASARANTSATATSGYDSTVTSLKSNSGNIVARLDVGASGSEGKAGSVTVGNVNATTGAVKLEIDTLGGVLDGAATVGNVSAGTNITIDVTGAAGSDVTVSDNTEQIEQDGVGGIYVNVDLQSSASRTSEVHVAAAGAAGGVTHGTISAVDSVSLDLAVSGESGLIGVGNVKSGEGNVIVVASEVGKNSEVSIGTLDALGASSEVSVSIQSAAETASLAGSAFVDAIVAESDVNVITRGLAGSAFTAANITSNSGEVNLLAVAASSTTAGSQSTVSFAHGGNIKGSGNVAVTASVGDGGTLKVGAVESVNKAVGIDLTLGRGDGSQDIEVGAITGETGLALDVSVGTGVSGNIDLLTADTGNATANFVVGSSASDTSVLTLAGVTATTGSAGVTANLSDSATFNVTAAIKADSNVSLTGTLAKASTFSTKDVTSNVGSVSISSKAGSSVTGVNFNLDNVTADKAASVAFEAGNTSTFEMADLKSTASTASLDIALGNGAGSKDLTVGKTSALGNATLDISAGTGFSGNIDTVTSDTGSVEIDVALNSSGSSASTLVFKGATATVGSTAFNASSIGTSGTVTTGTQQGDSGVSLSGNLERNATLNAGDLTSGVGVVDVDVNGGVNTGTTLTLDAITADKAVTIEFSAGNTAKFETSGAVKSNTDSVDVVLSFGTGTGSQTSSMKGVTAFTDLNLSLSGGAGVSANFDGLTSTTGNVDLVLDVESSASAISAFKAASVTATAGDVDVALGTLGSSGTFTIAGATQGDTGVKVAGELSRGSSVALTGAISSGSGAVTIDLDGSTNTDLKVTAGTTITALGGVDIDVIGGNKTAVTLGGAVKSQTKGVDVLLSVGNGSGSKDMEIKGLTGETGVTLDVTTGTGLSGNFESVTATTGDAVLDFDLASSAASKTSIAFSGAVSATTGEVNLGVNSLGDSGTFKSNAITADSDVTITGNLDRNATLTLGAAVTSNAGEVIIDVDAGTSSGSTFTASNTISALGAVDIDVVGGNSTKVALSNTIKSLSKGVDLLVSVGTGGGKQDLEVKGITGDTGVIVDITAGAGTVGNFDTVTATTGDVVMDFALGSSATSASSLTFGGAITASAGSVDVGVNSLGASGKFTTAGLVGDSGIKLTGDLSRGTSVTTTTLKSDAGSVTVNLDAGTNTDVALKLGGTVDALNAIDIDLVGGTKTSVAIGGAVKSQTKGVDLLVDIGAGSGSKDLEVKGLTGETGVIVDVSTGTGVAGNFESFTANTGAVTLDLVIDSSATSKSTVNVTGNIAATTGSIDLGLNSLGASGTFKADGTLSADDDVTLTGSLGRSSSVTTGVITATTGKATVNLVQASATDGAQTVTLGNVTAGKNIDLDFKLGNGSKIAVTKNLKSDASVDVLVDVGTGGGTKDLTFGNVEAGSGATYDISTGAGVFGNIDNITVTSGNVGITVDMASSSTSKSSLSFDPIKASNGDVTITATSVGASGTLKFGTIDATAGTLKVTGSVERDGTLSINTVQNTKNLTVDNLVLGDGASFKIAKAAPGFTTSDGAVSIDITTGSIGSGGAVVLGNIEATTGDVSVTIDSSSTTSSSAVTLPTITGDTVHLTYEGHGAGGALTTSIDATGTSSGKNLAYAVNAGNIDFAGNLETDTTLWQNYTAVTTIEGSSDVGLTLKATKGSFTLTSLDTVGKGGLTLTGTNAASNDLVFGGNFDDTISTGAGNDVIFGRGGMDILTGGAGADVFGFSGGDSGITLATMDRILDFTIGTDHIALGGIESNIVAGNVEIAVGFNSGSTLNDFLTAASTFFADTTNAEWIYTAGNFDLIDVNGAAGTGGNTESLVAIDINQDGLLDATDVVFIVVNTGAADTLDHADFLFIA